MKAVAGTVVVSILGKDYTVACPADEQEALAAAARFLDGRMRAVQDGGKVVGLDRCAVVAGLNIVNELLASRSGGLAPEVSERLQLLADRIGRVLEQELVAG